MLTIMLTVLLIYSHENGLIFDFTMNKIIMASQAYSVPFQTSQLQRNQIENI